MERKYWAKRGRQSVGPFDGMEAALAAFRTEYPHKGPDYLASAKVNQIMTGYGEQGAYFDIRWHDAKARGND